MDKRMENTIYGILTGTVLCAEIFPIHDGNFEGNAHLEHDNLTEILKTKCGPVFLAPQKVLEKNAWPTAAAAGNLTADALVDINAFSVTPSLSPYHWKK